MKQLFLFIFGISFSLFLLASCNKSYETSTINQAHNIRSAINNNNTKQLLDISTLPFQYREQEWESANDGYGFILGSVKQTNLSNDEEFINHFNSAIHTIHIQGQDVITEGITIDLFSEELGDQKTFWKPLNLALFKRGEGDVEHIVLFGFDKKNSKLRAIYIN